MRGKLAADRALCAEVLGGFIGALSRSLRWRAKRTLGLASVEDALVGALAVIQRSDSLCPVAPVVRHRASLPTVGRPLSKHSPIPNER